MHNTFHACIPIYIQIDGRNMGSTHWFGPSAEINMPHYCSLIVDSAVPCLSETGMHKCSSERAVDHAYAAWHTEFRYDIQHMHDLWFLYPWFLVFLGISRDGIMGKAFRGRRTINWISWTLRWLERRQYVDV